MKLPQLETPERYTGLYIFDFGDQVAVGYTADEIAVLLETERYADGKVYRIHRALPDGTLELQGVPRERFQLEDGVFFYRSEETTARKDFDDLRQLASDTPPPCRVKLLLARFTSEPEQYATAAVFPAEFTDDIAAWLNAADYRGGDLVEGGPSQVAAFRGADVRELATAQLWPASSDSRSAEEVLASTGRMVQRVPA